MNKYMKTWVQFKFVWGLIFTASIILYTTISMLLGKSSMNFIVVWQFAFATLLLTAQYYLMFSELIINSMSNRTRISIHFAISYVTLLILGWLMKLMDITDLSHIAIFTVGIVLLYLAAMFSLFVYYKATGEELNKKLAAYKQKKNID